MNRTERINDAVDVILKYRRTHILWLDWLKTASAYERERYHYAGDRAHHIEVIAAYDRVIDTLESLKEEQ